MIPAEAILTGPQKTNPMDPASQQKMDEYNAQVKARNDRIYHSADNLRWPNSGASTQAAANPMAMMNPDMMQKIMACGSDQACKQQVAMEMMSQKAPPAGPHAQVQADIQAISDMCIHEKSQKMGTKGYEDCMNAEGRKRSTVPASAADDEPEVAELPGLPALSELRRRLQVHRSHEDQREHHEYLCGRAGVGQTTTTPDSIRLPPEIAQWITETLRGAPLSGSLTKKFGYQTAKFTWSIVRE